jgi:hypothetical protein
VGQHQPAVPAQDPDRLGDQGARVGEALEHVVAEHPVEGGVGQGQGRLQVDLEVDHRVDVVRFARHGGNVPAASPVG